MTRAHTKLCTLRCSLTAGTLRFLLVCHIFVEMFVMYNCHDVTRVDAFALLSGTLRTFKRAGCDDELIALNCPTATSITIQHAHYAAAKNAPILCPHNKTDSKRRPKNVDTVTSAIDDVTDRQNDTCVWPNALQTVVEACQKKRQCKFHPSVKQFGGDPCPSMRKYVQVEYKCRPYEFRSKVACQNDMVELKCDANSRLAVYTASFGRTEYESVHCPQPQGVAEETCLVSYATETVMHLCHGKRKCTLSADAETFGSPCRPASRMYLKIVYTCVPRNVLNELYDNSLEYDEVENVTQSVIQDEYDRSGVDASDRPADPSDRVTVYTALTGPALQSLGHREPVTRIHVTKHNDSVTVAQVASTSSDIGDVPARFSPAPFRTTQPWRPITTKPVRLLMSSHQSTRKVYPYDELRAHVTAARDNIQGDHVETLSVANANESADESDSSKSFSSTLLFHSSAVILLFNGPNRVLVAIVALGTLGVLICASVLMGRYLLNRRRQSEDKTKSDSDPTFAHAFTDEISDINDDFAMETTAIEIGGDANMQSSPEHVTNVTNMRNSGVIAVVGYGNESLHHHHVHHHHGNMFNHLMTSAAPSTLDTYHSLRRPSHVDEVPRILSTRTPPGVPDNHFYFG